MPMIYKAFITFILIYSLISAGRFIIKERKAMPEPVFTQVFERDSTPYKVNILESF